MERSRSHREPIYQLGFDGTGQWSPPVDVTPKHMRLRDPETEYLMRVGRFVRELEEGMSVTSPAEVAHYLMTQVYTPFAAFDQEELWVLLLNVKHKITHDALVYRGTVNASSVRIAEVFKQAIRHNRPAIILAHNHPSGDPLQSREDIHVTNQVIQAGRLLDVELLDHIIVGDGRWTSLREQGLGEWGVPRYRTTITGQPLER